MKSFDIIIIGLLALVLATFGFNNVPNRIHKKFNSRGMSHDIVARGKIKIEDESYLSRIEDEDELSKRIDRPVWLNIFSTKNDINITLSSPSVTVSEPVQNDRLISWLPKLDAWKSAFGTQGTPSTADIALPISLEQYLSDSRSITGNHINNVEELWLQLKNHGKMKYLTHVEAKLVKEALTIAYVALWGKKTARSLEVAINRARGAAAVLGELKADLEVILASILHEVVRDVPENNFVYEKIVSIFGMDVMNLSKKYCELPKYMARTAVYTPMQSEYQIQMLIAVAKDYRTLYIRLADRVHTLRVLRTLPLDDKERIKIAQEAINVYAPLAHKMGIMKIKGELEDLSFRVLDPKMFQKTRYTQTAANKAYHDAAEIIQDVIAKDEYLVAQNTTYRLTYRIKDKYQLALKAKRKNLKSFGEVRDALGLRIITSTIRGKQESEEAYKQRCSDICYYIIDCLKKLPGWETVPDGFKDYIAGTKTNGYQSLHQYIKNTALGTNVEVQVRTKEMHIIAELGEAAHWHYKDQIYRPEVANSKAYRLAWRSDSQSKAKSPAELIGMAKSQLLASRVFVFLEDKSTVLPLKKGVTALDAAFAIHSNIGLSARCIKIDGVPVSYNRLLANGETVSVEVEPAGVYSAKPTWLNAVKSSSAQAILRRYFRDNHRIMLICLGFSQLLMALALNMDRIKRRSKEGKLPDAQKIIKYSTSRAGYADIVELLVTLGTAPKDVTVAIMSKLFDIPTNEMVSHHLTWGLAWSKDQSRHGWHENDFASLYIVPMIKEILPSLGYSQVESKWLDLMQTPSLTSGAHTSIPTASTVVVAEGVENVVPQIEEIVDKSPSSTSDVTVVSRRRGDTSKDDNWDNYIARRPYSLEAMQLNEPILRMAKKSFAQKHRNKSNTM